MKKSKKILLKWASTYGEEESDVKASMYNEDMMIEFAKYYHKQKLTLTDVNQHRELLIAFNIMLDYDIKRDSIEESVDYFLKNKWRYL